MTDGHLTSPGGLCPSIDLCVVSEVVDFLASNGRFLDSVHSAARPASAYLLPGVILSKVFLRAWYVEASFLRM
jgi:hypothetical protein